MSVAIAWTGGKDSALALHRCAGRDVSELVTFVPRDAHFLAHDLELMRWQADAVGMPHRCELVESPYEAGYERALQRLLERGVHTVVTGDIAEVDGQPNFLSARATRVGLRVELPLWGVDRITHLRSILELGFEVVLTLVKEPWLDASWAGRRLDAAALEELLLVEAATGLDPAGENGEYHSMVLAGPGWRQRLALESRLVSASPVHRIEVLGVRASAP